MHLQCLFLISSLPFFFRISHMPAILRLICFFAPSVQYELQHLGDAFQTFPTRDTVNTASLMFDSFFLCTQAPIQTFLKIGNGKGDARLC